MTVELRKKLRTRLFTILPLVALAAAACSLIVDPSTDQCTTDADCAHHAGAVCRAGLCVSSSSSAGDSSVDGPVTPGGDGGEAGCVPKTSTPDDFLNDQCTNAECFPFDNCARAGLCDGGSLPPLVTPPAGGV